MDNNTAVHLPEIIESRDSSSKLTRNQRSCPGLAFSSNAKGLEDFETRHMKKSGLPHVAPDPSSSRTGAPWLRVNVSDVRAAHGALPTQRGQETASFYTPVTTPVMLELSRRLGPRQVSPPHMFSIRNLKRPVVAWQVPCIDKAFLFSFLCKCYQEVFRRKLMWVISFCHFVPCSAWV